MGPRCGVVRSSGANTAPRLVDTHLRKRLAMTSAALQQRVGQREGVNPDAVISLSFEVEAARSHPCSPARTPRIPQLVSPVRRTISTHSQPVPVNQHCRGANVLVAMQSCIHTSTETHMHTHARTHAHAHTQVCSAIKSPCSHFSAALRAPLPSVPHSVLLQTVLLQLQGAWRGHGLHGGVPPASRHTHWSSETTSHTCICMLEPISAVLAFALPVLFVIRRHPVTQLRIQLACTQHTARVYTTYSSIRRGSAPLGIHANCGSGCVFGCCVC